jgi:hypothetical protein
MRSLPVGVNEYSTGAIVGESLSREKIAYLCYGYTVMGLIKRDWLL